ncbi:MAG: hypothetical protein ABI266_06375 [Ginsengibacter sp.]
MQLGFQVILEEADPHGEAWIQMSLSNAGATISLAGFQASFVKK